MFYNSVNFFVFFPLIFLLYYIIPGNFQKTRNSYLLFVSYLLYINWKPSLALVMLCVTLSTYTTARLFRKRNKKKIIAVIGGVVSIFPLLIFKYFNFINDNVYILLSSLGIKYELYGLNWAIPIGLSFYSFQAIGYLMDVYYKRIEAEKDFLAYALFISFFPSIVAGPINKASKIIPQIKNLRPYFDYGKAVDGLKMILWGMFSKVVVADRLGLYVDTILPNYMNYTGSSCLIASFLYTIQIYADFAGYSLIAIGVGKTLGFELTPNFRRPYFAVSVSDFWHRWHISLSTWLKDYVYIPLGGSRCTKYRNYWNIFVTFLVSGIWHGANWTFVVWGAIHGFFLIIEKILGQQKSEYGLINKAFRIIITFMVVSFAWIFFRMPTLSDSIGVILRIFDFSLSMVIYMDIVQTLPFVFLGVTLLFLKDFRDEFLPKKFLLMSSRSVYVRWTTYLLLLVIILSSGVLGADQFIYSNF